MPNFAKGFAPRNAYGIDHNTYNAINIQAQKKVAAALLTQVTLETDFTPDASEGAIFDITLLENSTIPNPANGTDGQRIILRIRQGAGSSTVTWGSAYRFSADLPEPALSTTIYLFDIIEFMYCQDDARWDCTRIVKGFDDTPT
jgi:hypothetical protein